MVFSLSCTNGDWGDGPHRRRWVFKIYYSVHCFKFWLSAPRVPSVRVFQISDYEPEVKGIDGTAQVATTLRESSHYTTKGKISAIAFN